MTALPMATIQGMDDRALTFATGTTTDLTKVLIDTSVDNSH